MKVKKDLFDFIKKNMEFETDSITGQKRLLIRDERLMLLTKDELEYANSIIEKYLEKQISRVREYPLLTPGLIVELVCGEKYLIISSPGSFSDITGEAEYKMVGLNETLNTCMFRDDLRLKPVYARLTAKILDISKIYRVDNYGPGLSILLGDPVPEYSLVEIWKR